MHFFFIFKIFFFITQIKGQQAWSAHFCGDVEVFKLLNCFVESYNPFLLTAYSIYNKPYHLMSNSLSMSKTSIRQIKSKCSLVVRYKFADFSSINDSLWSQCVVDLQFKYSVRA